jgi:hypothetical protein
MSAASASPRLRLWAKRLLLAVASALCTALALEAAVRLAGVPSAPVEMREGIYVSQLPMVTGRDTGQRVEGSPRPTAKRPGEIRVFVFGESSVEGGPWGYGGSPATMLRDHLHAMVPGKDITVVNMGRSASTMMDAYYYLVSIEGYAPDYIVFYQGSNDFFNTDPERCAPVAHPALYGAHRWLATHSRLVWAARTLGPRWWLKRVGPRPSPQLPHVFGSDQQPGDRCDVAQAFPAWTDLLVSTAESMGARVVVTTPVENPLRWADDNMSHVAEPGEPYRRLLGCALDGGCDMVATWKAVRDTPSFAWDRLASRRRAWRETAAARGARFVDFAGYLGKEAEGGLRPPIFAEEVHLLLEGYWRVSWLWAQELRSLMEAGPSMGIDVPPPPALDERYYLAESARLNHGGTGTCALLHAADRYVRLNMRVLAAPLLRKAVEIDAPPSAAGADAALLLGKLRRDAGLDPALPPALAGALPGLDPARITEALQRSGDCSALPAPR